MGAAGGVGGGEPVTAGGADLVTASFVFEIYCTISGHTDILDLARQYNVEMPIAETVATVLDGNVAFGDAISLLMSRQPRPEL